jgi:AcrR family transcriptional regulator
MPSHLAVQPRRVPTQQRGERRVAELLDAAASVIAEAGYEAATMSDIADRAGASIGSLYQFFPNKLSLTQALRNRYAVQFEDVWVPLERDAETLSLERLCDRLIDSTIRFVKGHPAFLALFDAPPSTRSPAAIRNVFRERVAGFLLASRPGMSKTKALRLANITLEIIKALNRVYSEIHPQERAAYVKEFKLVLFAYLRSRTETT